MGTIEKVNPDNHSRVKRASNVYRNDEKKGKWRCRRASGNRPSVHDNFLSFSFSFYLIFLFLSLYLCYLLPFHVHVFRAAHRVLASHIHELDDLRQMDLVYIQNDRATLPPPTFVSVGRITKDMIDEFGCGPRSIESNSFIFEWLTGREIVYDPVRRNISLFWPH